MSGIKVVQLKIERFRRFKDVEIPIGHRMTLLAGQNGTAKSTLLGMLAQPFSFGVVRGNTAGEADKSAYIGVYHGQKLNEHVDLTGKRFMYDCDDVFRLSEEFDFGKSYEYTTRLSFPTTVKATLQNNSLLTKSRDRKKGKNIVGMRFVTGPRASHQSGEGNFPHPVIYLGLNRLWPLASTRKCTFPSAQLPDQERDWYVEKYNEILCLSEHDNSAQFMDTLEKQRFITPYSSDYNGESCSAGQDNLSQILTALLSFRRLKDALGPVYQGGLLLLDELDATLHPFAQPRLMDLLRQEAAALDLQVVATTHSLVIIEHAFQSKATKDTLVNYLVNVDGEIQPEKFSTYQEISDHLNLTVTAPKKKAPKVPVIFEDKEAGALFWKVCGSKLRDFVVRANAASVSAGALKTLGDLSKSVPLLAECILLADGDMASSWPKRPANLLLLPGKFRLETEIYRFLFQMADSSPFWKACGSTYSKQFAIIGPGGTHLTKGDDKDWVKNWYRKQSKYWGKGNHLVFKAWIQAHEQACLDFSKAFVNLVQKKYRGQLPREIAEKVLAPYQPGK